LKGTEGNNPIKKEPYQKKGARLKRPDWRTKKDHDLGAGDQTKKSLELRGSLRAVARRRGQIQESHLRATCGGAYAKRDVFRKKNLRELAKGKENQLTDLTISARKIPFLCCP